MELRRYLQILRRRIVIIVAAVVIAMGIAWVATPRSSQYVARSNIYVGSRQFNDETVSNDRFAGLDRIALTYSKMIDSRPIAQDAIDRLGLPRSAPSVVAQTVAGPLPQTQLIEVKVTDPDPAAARDLANALGDAFVAKVRKFEGTIDTTSSNEEGSVPSGLPAYVYERASLPTVPEPSGLLQNVLLAGLFALLGSAALVFVFEYLDVTIRTAADAENRIGLPVLGVIPLLPVEDELSILVRQSVRASSPTESETQHA